jgi:hypothetical protein
LTSTIEGKKTKEAEHLLVGGCCGLLDDAATENEGYYTDRESVRERESFA